MKKYTIVFLLTAILCASLLGACGEQNEPELPFLEPAAKVTPAAEPEAAAQSPAAPAGETASTGHIVDAINECHTIDADVIGPASAQVARHRMEFLSVTVEQAAEALCPGDTIVSKNKPEDRPYTLAATAGGKQIQVDPTLGMVSFQPTFDADPGWEWVYVCGERFLADYPEKQEAELDFMTAGEAKEMVAKAFRDLGVALEPEFILCAGVRIEELDAYVKEIRTENEMMKDLFDGSDFSGLPENADSYLIKVNFNYDGTHLLGWEGEPGVGMRGWESPSTIGCYMVISADGFQYLQSYGLLANPETLDSAPVISAEEAVEIYKNMEDANFSTEFETVVTSVFLEYVPIPDGKQVILTPYWCLDRQDKMEFPDLHPWQAYRGSGTRINAYTGGDLAKWE